MTRVTRNKYPKVYSPQTKRMRNRKFAFAWFELTFDLRLDYFCDRVTMDCDGKNSILQTVCV